MTRFMPPENGVAVRMYRQGHGDCFLMAMPREDGDEPVYVLIDCGFKPGSPSFVKNKKIGAIVKHIGAATNNHIDLMIVTHEHQDHVNGIWKKRNPHFKDLVIDEVWLAWTEDPTDDLANTLRQRHKDQLLGLIEARNKLALAAGEDESPEVGRLDALLHLEFGGERDRFSLRTLLAAAKDPSKSLNKQAIRYVKEKAAANRGVRYLSPGDKIETLAGTGGVRAYILGPPRSDTLLEDEDPVGSEAFPGATGGAHHFSFAAAARAEDGPGRAPFRLQHCVSSPDAAAEHPFFATYYGVDEVDDDRDEIEVPSNAPWRRIDAEWLFAAESLALKLNRGINNTSLVVAFELPQSKKVLLFAGDAQRGNWVSWKDHTWQDGDEDVTARDILGRTVLYKVGHHGSHNATLAGTEDDDYPNLAWMAKGAYAGEFTAMITAVNEWAMTKNNPPWRHPLPSIRAALDQKAQGRVFQTDEDEPAQPAGVSDMDWAAFHGKAVFDDLYFDYLIADG